MDTVKHKAATLRDACTSIIHFVGNIATDPEFIGLIVVISLFTIIIGTVIEQPSFFYFSFRQLFCFIVSIIGAYYSAVGWLWLGNIVLGLNKAYTDDKMHEIPADHTYERNSEAINVDTPTAASTSTSTERALSTARQAHSGPKTVIRDQQPPSIHEFDVPSTPGIDRRVRKRNSQPVHHSGILGPSPHPQRFQTRGDDVPVRQHPRMMGLNGTPAVQGNRSVQWEHFSGNGFWESTEREIETRAAVGASRPALEYRHGY